MAKTEEENMKFGREGTGRVERKKGRSRSDVDEAFLHDILKNIKFKNKKVYILEMLHHS